MLAPAQFPLQIVELVPKPFDGDDWLFEIKHDGFRMLAISDAARLALKLNLDDLHLLGIVAGNCELLIW